MRAIQANGYGPPDVLEPVDLPTPEPIATEVLVRVQAAGVNPVDWKTRAHGPGGVVQLEPPVVLGWDVAGVVDQVGGGVTRFAVGDEVFGMPWFPRLGRAYAEYVTAPSRQFARIPEGLDTVQAGGLPLAGLTAWQALVDTAGVTRGDRVLIHAAAGGVGHLAVQIAKSRGAHIIATARANKHDFLRGLGVEQIIDYTDVAFEVEAGEVDVVLDLVGGEAGLDAFPALRDGGVFVAVPSSAGLEALHELADGRVRVTGILVEPDRAGLEALAELVSVGELRPHVSHTFPLADAARAHELGETGRTQGKLVLTLG